MNSFDIGAIIRVMSIFRRIGCFLLLSTILLVGWGCAGGPGVEPPLGGGVGTFDGGASGKENDNGKIYKGDGGVFTTVDSGRALEEEDSGQADAR